MEKYLFIVLLVGVVSLLTVIAILWFKIRKSSKSKDEKFLEKTARGREILAEIKLSEAEIRRAKKNKESGEEQARVLEIEKKILALKAEVAEARKNAEAVPGKDDAAKSENSTAETVKDSNPIGEYREGARNRGWWIAICVVAGILIIVSLSLGKVWSITVPAIAIILGIVVALLIKGASTVTEGYVGVVKCFKKYSGTINPGLTFLVPGINEYEEIPVGEQTMPLNLTTKENGDVELDNHVSIGVEAVVYYRILKEGAHLALFNINTFEVNGYEKALNKLMDGMMRSYLAKHAFGEVNAIRGKSLMLNLFKATGEKNEEEGDLSDSDLYLHLSNSKNWLDIRQDWGIEVLDVVITDFIFSEEDEKAWRLTFQANEELNAAKVGIERAEVDVEIAKVGVKKAVQERLRRIELAEAKKRELTLEGEGVGNQILIATEASNAGGPEVLSFLNRRQKYEAVASGAHTVLLDEGQGNNGASLGAALAASMSMFNTLNAKPNERENNETKTDSRGTKNPGKRS